MRHTREPQESSRKADLAAVDQMREMWAKGVVTGPAVEENYAFQRACENGHLAVANRLLELRAVGVPIDPTAHDNCAFLYACENGHLAVANRLLELRAEGVDIDPTADDNYAFWRACDNGHLAVVERLLELRAEGVPIDPTADGNLAFWGACENGHLAVVERLLDHMPILAMRPELPTELYHHRRRLRLLRRLARRWLVRRCRRLVAAVGRTIPEDVVANHIIPQMLHPRYDVRVGRGRQLALTPAG